MPDLYERIYMSVNTATKLIVNAVKETPLRFPEKPRFLAGDTYVLCITYLDGDYAAIDSWDANDAFAFFGDPDFDHAEDEGTLSNGYSGAVTEIAGTGFSSTPPDTGALLLRNDAGQRERIAYTAVAGTDPYTFTVDATLANTYLEGDYVGIEDTLAIVADNDDVNIAGDWDEADTTAGKISVRIACDRWEFLNKITAASGQQEFYLQHVRYPGGGSAQSTLCQDTVRVSKTVRDIESTTSTPQDSYAALDARYIKILDAAVATATEVTVASGVISRAQTSHSVDTEGDAATDDLDTISDGTNGDLLILMLENASRVVTLKHATGNIVCPGGVDVEMDQYAAYLLMHDGSNWRILAGGTAGGGGSIAWADITGKPSVFTPDTHTHPQSEVTDLETDLAEIESDISAIELSLADKLEAADLADYLKADFTEYTTKTADFESSDSIAILDGSTNKRMFLSQFARASDVEELQDIQIENGIADAASTITDANHGHPVVASRTMDDVPAEVVFGTHFDGSPGATTFTDRSANDYTPTMVGTPLISDDVEVETGSGEFGRVLAFDGASGFNIPAQDFADDAFDIEMRAYIPTASALDRIPLFHEATGSDASKVIEAYLDNGYLHVNMGWDAETGWSASLQYGPGDIDINLDAFNYFRFRRAAAGELLIDVNTEIIDRYQMTGRVLNTPDPASKLRFGYDIDAISAPDNFAPAGVYFDEIWVMIGDHFDDVDADAQSIALPAERYVVKEYIRDPNATAGSRYMTFSQTDIDTNGTDSWVDLQHDLNQEVVAVEVWKSGTPKEKILPDDIKASTTDAENIVRIYLTNFVPITGSWVALILARANGVGGDGVSDHGSLTGRSDVDSHPAAAISYDNSVSGLAAEDAQEAIDELADAIASISPTVARTDLTDGPGDYTGAALKGMRANATEDGFEFYRVSDAVVNDISSGDHTLVIADPGKVISLSEDADQDVEIPLHSIVALDTNVQCEVRSVGTGAKTVTAVSGVTLNGVDGGSIALGSGGSVLLWQIAEDAWLAFGSIVTGSYIENPMTTQGDIITAAASGIPQRLAVGAAGTSLVSDGTDPGWGYQAIAPIVINGLNRAPDAIGQGTWTVQAPGTYLYGSTGLKNSGVSDGDNITYNVPLIPGVWELDINAPLAANRGKLDVFIGAQKVVDAEDLYDAGTDSTNVISATGIAVTTETTIKFAVNGKNASSSAYGVSFTEFRLTRTGDPV